ncbi:MAG: UDP-N-acetylmuramate dehydrogenase [Candidatus Korobacteraceae bacterium]|jgi:UDP-N-acetylmuramate dehydrogenase
MLIRENVPLAPLTTLEVGGPARYFAEARAEAEVMEAVEFARSRGLPLFVLGGGSNLVIADAGFAGLVLKVGITDLAQLTASHGQVTFVAGAGYDWDTLVKESVQADCAGLECLSGIPGTVGGTPVQNVGAYGQEVSQTIREVRVLDLQSREITTLSNTQCGFAYRSSIFNTTERGRYVILRVSFALRQGGGPSIRYADLEQFFSRSNAPTLCEVREAVRDIRQRKAMLIVPGDEDSHSVGSFFKNPIVPRAICEELSARLASRGLQLPSYPSGDGFRKLPVAWLVEHAGFAKGYRKGRVGISQRHALAIINRGGASAAEIIALKDEIQARVMDTFGIRLDPEPVFVGF